MSFFEKSVLNKRRSATQRATFRPCLEVLEDRLAPATFAVSNSNQAGFGSLRQAIFLANINPGLDSIVFDPAGLLGNRLRTIEVTTELPAITDPVTIIGRVNFGRPQDEIRGPGAGSGFSGLRLDVGSDGSRIKNLTINGFFAMIKVDSNNNTIQGCRIGTTSDGNAVTGNGSGIRLQGNASGNLIGGATPQERNLISSTADGVLLVGTGTNNTIRGNFIGTNAAGTAAVGNFNGITFGGGASNSLVENNTISGNFITGIRLASSTNTGITIRANRIGLRADTLEALPNGRHGVAIVNGAHDNIIGGTVLADGNLIHFNSVVGVLIGSDPSVGGTLAIPAGQGNQVLSNSIGASPILLDLGPLDGLNLNDALDADVGPNNFQNVPGLTSATTNASGVFLVGALSSKPSQSYRIEFFQSNDVVNGIPQSLTRLSAAIASTNAGGALPIGVQFGALPSGTFITATATDLATGDTSEISVGVFVNSPMITNDVLTPQIVEGGVATLSGQLVDLDPDDILGLTVNWGDGSREQTFRPGHDPFAVTHRYLDDGVYDVRFTWFDNRGGSKSRTRQVLVTNDTPILTDLSLHLVAPAQPLFSLDGRVVDAGPRDTFTVSINWGDGTSDRPSLNTARPFRLHHRFRNSGTFTVAVTVIDDDGGASAALLTAIVGP